MLGNIFGYSVCGTRKKSILYSYWYGYGYGYGYEYRYRYRYRYKDIDIDVDIDIDIEIDTVLFIKRIRPFRALFAKLIHFMIDRFLSLQHYYYRTIWDDNKLNQTKRTSRDNIYEILNTMGIYNIIIWEERTNDLSISTSTSISISISVYAFVTSSVFLLSIIL